MIGCTRIKISKSLLKVTGFAPQSGEALGEKELMAAILNF